MREWMPSMSTSQEVPSPASLPAPTPAPSQAQSPLQLLGPGIVHAFGNSLFAVAGHAAVLGGSAADVTRGRNAILRATEQAQGTLEILRFLFEEPMAACPMQAGVLLHRMLDVLRVPLRERGLRCELAHSSNETPVLVDGGTLCRAVARLITAILHALPAGWQGSLLLDLVRQEPERVEMKVAMRESRGFLPFPVPLRESLTALAEKLATLGVELEWNEVQQQAHLALRPLPVDRT